MIWVFRDTVDGSWFHAVSATGATITIEPVRLGGFLVVDRFYVRRQLPGQSKITLRESRSMDAAKRYAERRFSLVDQEEV